MTTRRDLSRAARRLADLLKSRRQRIVFAESCTGGLVSAVLTEVSGISQWHCGSAVVYQVATKIAWLGVDPDKLRSPGPVSRVVAEQMAAGVFERTPAATTAASITGHLGPNAPAKQDGLVYVGVLVAAGGREENRPQIRVVRRVLDAGNTSGSSRPATLRRQRQMAAAHLVLETVSDVLEKLPAPADD